MTEQTIAADYAAALLSSLAVKNPGPLDEEEPHPALAWARSGLMALTGEPDGEPLMCAAPLAACADGALAALKSIAPAGTFGELRGAALLGERAAHAGLRRAGATAPGGSCRLLAAADGRFAISLVRADDWAMVPAWLEKAGQPDWDFVTRVAGKKPVSELIERGRMMGLAIAPDAPCDPSPARWFATRAYAPRAAAASAGAPLVVDLSSLWAGPLCSHLLQKLGVRVIKIEGSRRPDGARLGNAAFFDLLNAGKECVAVDTTTSDGRERLRALLMQADIVIEGSRPRALRQLGIHAETFLEKKPGLSWISLSGYGRGLPQENWTAFGDDAGVAAGLSDLIWRATGRRVFVGDAIADPLTGLHAALAAWASYLDGGGRLISIALCEVVRHCMQFDGVISDVLLRERQAAWSAMVTDVMPPSVRAPAGKAHDLGADTAAVFAELGIGTLLQAE